MQKLDQQMRQWAPRLRDDLGIQSEYANAIATTISREVGQLPGEVMQSIRECSPVPLEDRIEELIAFQDFMDALSSQKHPRPSFVRAQVIYQNYISFVYLGDACFNILKRELPARSSTKRCAKFLSDNPVRAFRNAIAHANWRYLADFSGIEFWARKGAGRDEPMARFTVTQNELGFWQSLSRCLAYTAFLTLQENDGKADGKTGCGIE